MNISENLQRILTDKQNIANAINAKGVSCQFSESLDTYADKISRISGGGGVEPVFSDSDPLTFVGIHDSNYVALINEGATNNKVFEYNKNGSGWTTYIENSKIEINKYEYVQFRSNSTLACSTNSSYEFRRFITGGLFKCYGTISSLINNSNSVPANAFVRLFQGTNILTAPALPGTSLGDHVYMSMFANCSNLTKAPALPATTLNTYCYQNMFDGCSSLTTAPALPATTLAKYCYSQMFRGCSSLTTTPTLPATTLANYCYQDMFVNCINLTTAPTLQATKLATYCYYQMFKGCSSLTTAPALPATTLANYCYYYMFDSCSSLTTAPALPATTLANYCYQGMFYGCSSLTTAPALQATTLATNCYYSMFGNCSSLTTAPALPATTLVNYCYQGMFRNCSKLNYIKAMFTTTPGNSYTKDWVNNVSSNGTFVKNVKATWTTTGYSAIPIGWTVQTASS